MRQKILVTGGAGYVGRTLIRQLYADHDVLVIDTLRFGLGRLTETDLRNIRLENVDLRSAEAVRDVVEGFQPDVIVHLAAMHYIPECETDPSMAVAINVLGTVNLLNAAPAGCRFVFASSGAVYAPQEDLHHERNSPIAPSDVYGWTKLQGEQYVHYFAQSRKLAGVVVRLFNVVGPGETNPHLMPEIVAQLKAGQTVVRLGNMWPKRDYIHVADAAAGFRTVATQGVVEPGTIATVNLGTSRQYSVSEVLTRLQDVAGISFAIEQDPARMRPVDRPFLGADIGAIRARFGWKPAFTIDDAMADLWREPDLTEALLAKYALKGKVA